MPFHQPDQVRYFTFDSFDAEGLTHAAITRRGGASAAPWASLNVGATVGDDPASVQENRRRSFAALGRSLDTLFDVWQVHGVDVVCAAAPRPSEQPHQRADAILTDRPGVTLFMRFADCTPIFLYDPVKQVVGLVHAGWQGVVQATLAYALAAMQSAYGSRPENILAGIGPSIGPHHYQVGPDVITAVQRAFGADAAGLLHPCANGHSGSGDPDVGSHTADRRMFDLWNANRLLLERAGVRRVEIAGVCTACGLEDWYSHRAEKGRTGRFGALIAL
jgi:YfiH family protein